MSGDNIGNAPVLQETDLRKHGIEEVTAEEVAALDEGICPDCQGKKFLEGPHGGMCVNIECAGCGARFNVVPGVPGSFGKQRICRPSRNVTTGADVSAEPTPPPIELIRESESEPRRCADCGVQADPEGVLGKPVVLAMHRRDGLIRLCLACHKAEHRVFLTDIRSETPTLWDRLRTVAICAGLGACVGLIASLIAWAIDAAGK